MILYLAAAFQRQAEIHGYRQQLEADGHQVTSRWTDPQGTHSQQLTGTEDPDLIARWALEDMADLQQADTLVSFTSPGYGRGGRHAEYGAAYAWLKELILVGPREHVFHWLPDVWLFPDPESFLQWAKEGVNGKS